MAPAPARSVRATRKPRLLFRLLVLFLLRFAERRLSGLLFQEPPRTTRGAVQASGALGRIEPAAPEDRMAQAPGIGVVGMRVPGADASIDLIHINTAGSPLIAQATQSIAEAPNIILRQAAPPIVVEHEAEKLRRLRAWGDESLTRVKL